MHAKQLDAQAETLAPDHDESDDARGIGFGRTGTQLTQSNTAFSSCFALTTFCAPSLFDAPPCPLTRYGPITNKRLTSVHAPRGLEEDANFLDLGETNEMFNCPPSTQPPTSRSWSSPRQHGSAALAPFTTSETVMIVYSEDCRDESTLGVIISCS